MVLLFETEHLFQLVLSHRQLGSELVHSLVDLFLYFSLILLELAAVGFELNDLVVVTHEHLHLVLFLFELLDLRDLFA